MSNKIPGQNKLNTSSGNHSESVSCNEGSGDQATTAVRLQKFLARAGVASRRASEELITAERVAVNGVIITELGTKIDPHTDHVTVDGSPVGETSPSITLLLHKPAGYLTTMDDPQKRHTVAELIPQKQYPGLYPIGRLDRDTTGVLLFSTDGELGHQLLHPSHHVEKTYWALVEGRPSAQVIAHLSKGVMLEDGMTAPAQVRLLQGPEADQAYQQLALPHRSTHAAQRQRTRSYKGKNTNDCIVELIITEGRNHQVKRMFSAVGHPVIALHRQSFGTVDVGNVKRGAWRELSPEEVLQLRSSR